jgi:hypothetical protein
MAKSLEEMCGSDPVNRLGRCWYAATFIPGARSINRPARDGIAVRRPWRWAFVDFSVAAAASFWAFAASKRMGATFESILAIACNSVALRTTLISWSPAMPTRIAQGEGMG